MLGGRRGRSAHAALATLPLVAACATQREPAVPEAPPAADEPAWAHGTLATRFVARSTGGAHDLDLFEALSLDLGRAGVDPWSGQLSARAAWDLDGPSPEFPSLADTQGRALDGQIYTAYASRNGVGALEALRLGRQFVYDTPVAVWFDGAGGETRELGAQRWRTGFFGGVPVHAFEAGSSGDLALGVYEACEPWESARLRADWLHLRDQRSGFDGSEDLLAAALQQEFGERLSVEAKYSRLDGEDRDAALDATWTDEEQRFTAQAGWYRLLRPQASHVLELDPFFDELLTEYPYDEARLSATKDLGTSVHLQGGLDARRLVDSGDAGPFNHDFERYYLTTSFDALLPAQVALALTGEVWNSDADITTWGLDLSRRWPGGCEASLGSSYALFKFDPFAGSEREDVRTHYAALKCRVDRAATLSLRYEYEDDSGTDFQVLRWEATWRF